MSYVALLRGINLGKLNKVDMKSLKLLFEEMGFVNVRTYIQTGNVMFENLVKDEFQIESKLEEVYKFNIPVIIRSKVELTTVKQHPLFLKENVYVMFLKQSISNEQMDLLKSLVTDEFAVLNQNSIIVSLSQNYHQTKFTNTFFEKKLKIASTARNRNTVEKILVKM